MRALFDAGVDVFRINMSHTSHDMLKQMVKALRALSDEVGRPIGILCDLQGPKIRLGTAEWRPAACSRKARASSWSWAKKPATGPGGDYRFRIRRSFQAIKQKHALLIDDGKVCACCDGPTILPKPVEGAGVIEDRIGLMPDTLLPIGAMTPKDRSDLDAALELGVDWIADLCSTPRTTWPN